MALTSRQSAGYAVNGLSVARISGTTRLQARFAYPSRWLSSVTGFNVIWYAYGDAGPSRAWVVSNATVNKNESVGGWYQHTLDCPEDAQAQHLYCWVAPVASGTWKSGPDWAKSATVDSPWVAQALAEARGQLTRVTASQDGARVSIQWERVNEYQAYANVYRSVDGGEWALYRQVSAVSGSFVDAALARGSSYRYQLRAALSDKRTLGEATPVEEGLSFDAAPLPVEGLRARALTSTSMTLTWTNRGHVGECYDVEWSSDGDAWANNEASAISSATLEEAEADVYTVGGLDSATRWFARVRRRNETGASDWTTIVSTLLGTVPSAPTLGALPVSVPVDGTLAVSWTHNSEDGSAQSAFELELNGTAAVSGTTASAATVRPAEISVGDGGELRVRVRTKGALESWSDWSEPAVVQVWAQPSVGVSLVCGGSEVAGAATSMPMQLRVQLSAYVAGNHAIAWWADVSAGEGYPSTARDGSPAVVAEGERLWRLDAVPDDGTEVPPEGDACNRVCLLVTVDASCLRMEPNVSYVAHGGCVTAAGLRAEGSVAFTWDPSGSVGDPSAVLSYDPLTLSMGVEVACEDGAPGTMLSVWRVEQGGSAVLVAEGLAPGGTCVDPHPDFGSCVYRVVATDPESGMQSSAEFEAWVDEGALVVQWGERWEGDAEAEEVAPGVLSYAGSRIRLPYDVRIEEDREVEMAEVEYLGRRLPVLYVGEMQRQQLSASGTLYEDDDPGAHGRIRDLLSHGGPCYVRAPSGVGFWASVRGNLSADMGGVSTYSLTFKRVEG